MKPATLRSKAFEVARRCASARGERLVTTFSDDLSGDVARFHLFRSLRRLFPQTPSKAIARLIEEDFTP
ncbi:MAG: hypothetical protein ACOY0T_31005 [Myxococcota bacterium]